MRIYETLLAVALITILGSWYVSQTRLGFALRAIGEDETVARHTGINTTRVKVLCFALSASVMALVGAVLALRYPYIDASIAFNNTWSFQVLIAALLGGPTRPWGPARRRHPAGAAVGISGRHLPAPLQHRARPVLRRHRLLPARRRRPPARAHSIVAGLRRAPWAPGRPASQLVAGRLKARLARLNALWRM